MRNRPHGIHFNYTKDKRKRRVVKSPSKKISAAAGPRSIMAVVLAPGGWYHLGGGITVIGPADERLHGGRRYRTRRRCGCTCRAAQGETDYLRQDRPRLCDWALGDFGDVRCLAAWLRFPCPSPWRACVHRVAAPGAHPERPRPFPGRPQGLRHYWHGNRGPHGPCAGRAVRSRLFYGGGETGLSRLSRWQCRGLFLFSGSRLPVPD